MNNGMSEEAVQARREYNRQYLENHREQINARRRAWAKANPDKVKGYKVRHWEKKAQEAAALSEPEQN